MQFDIDAEPHISADVLYDLFYGGYLDPMKYVDEDSAKEVETAKEKIIEFIEGLEDLGLLEEM